MQICVVQRDGVRYFSRFKNLNERDRLEVEVVIEDRGGRVVKLDLTETLLEEYAKHKDIGSPNAPVEPLVAAQPTNIKKSRKTKPKVVTTKPLNELESEESSRKPKRKRTQSKTKKKVQARVEADKPKTEPAKAVKPNAAVKTASERTSSRKTKKTSESKTAKGSVSAARRVVKATSTTAKAPKPRSPAKKTRPAARTTDR